MKYLPFAVFLSAFATLVTPVSAATLVPGSFISTTGVTIDSTPSDPVVRPELAGTVVNDNIISFSYDTAPITVDDTFFGEIQNRVVENGDGFLIFAPRIRDLSFIFGSSTIAILGFTLEGYGTTALDVDFRLDGLGDKGPTSVSRSGSGDLMTFEYGDPLFVDSLFDPGRQEESLFPSLLSDATHFDFGGVMTIFATILPIGTDTLPDGALETFTIRITGLAAPTLAPVPLPATGLLLMGALGLIAGSKRRKQS